MIVTNKVALWAASYSACMVYTKTIIHLSVGESGGYLPRRGGSVNINHYSPPLWWIIVNYIFVEILIVVFVFKNTFNGSTPFSMRTASFRFPLGHLYVRGEIANNDHVKFLGVKEVQVENMCIKPEWMTRARSTSFPGSLILLRAPLLAW